MNRTYDRDEDRDLPWDPMWAYVLGEDTDDRDNRDDNTRQSTDIFTRGDENRDNDDTTSGGTILNKLWKRKAKETSPTTSVPTHSKSIDREEWSWEIDTSQFSLMSDESDRPKKKGDESDKKKWITASTKKIRDSIGTVWKDTPMSSGQNRSILSRKSS